MTLMQKALQRAVYNENVLFPHNAIEILVAIYGRQLDTYRPATIADKVTALCMKNGYDAVESEIIDAVNNWLAN